MEPVLATGVQGVLVGWRRGAVTQQGRGRGGVTDIVRAGRDEVVNEGSDRDGRRQVCKWKGRRGGDSGCSYRAELGFTQASEDQFFLPCMKCFIS